MADYNVSPGNNVSINNILAVQDRPKWLTWDNTTSMAGKVTVPSGFRRCVYYNSANQWGKRTYQVGPMALFPDEGQSWRLAIYDDWGRCILADDLPARIFNPDATSRGRTIQTVGTPQVRLTESAPAKAVVVFPATIPDNPASPDFDGWLDPLAPSTGNVSQGAIARGMELTVEYRDASTGTLELAFRGRIFNIERGTDGITVTAYDRIMDLATYSDQYTPPTLPIRENSLARTISGTTYTYRFTTNIGTIISAETYDLVEVNALGEMDRDGTEAGKLYIVPMPTENNAPPYLPGQRIDTMTVRVKVSKGMGTANTIKVHLETEFCLLEKMGDWYVCRAKHTAVNDYPSITSTHFLNVIASNMGWTIPENAYIGLRYTWSWEVVGTGTATPSAYIETSTTTYFCKRADYRIYNGDVAVGGQVYTTSAPGSDVPEIAFQYLGGPNTTPIGTGLVAKYQKFAIVNASNIPAGPTYTDDSATLTTIDAGAILHMVYYGADAIDLLATVQELIRNAGLDVGNVSGSLGGTSYYTSSTYDYLTCIRELLQAGNLGIRDRINEAGVIDILPRHTLDEAPVLEISTADSTKEQIITSHQITAHWMAEKATVAIIAEDTTSSGLPIALETDDELMDNSLADALDTPLRQVITDRSMGTHALLANAAGGRIVQLHTNVFEGQVVLAGYRLDVWDRTGAKTGGQPIGVDIPEAGASGTALPTEVIFADGATVVKLDNIRTADRSEVANSMGLTADGLSNSTTALPSTVYIFARFWSYYTQIGGVTVTAGSDLYLLDASGNTLATINDGPYLKHIDDAAGYHHIVGIMAGTTPGIADTVPVAAIKYGNNIYAPLDNPKYILAGQGVHVDLRVPKP